MRQKDFDYLVVAAMLLSGLYVAVTGFAADVLGLHEFAFHATAGYVCAGLGLMHLALNWRQVTGYLKRRFGRGERRDRPERAPMPRAPVSGRRQLVVGGLAAVGGLVLGRLIARQQAAPLPYDAADIGELYHQWSKPGASQVLGGVLSWGGRPAQYKDYVGAERISLPDPGGHHGLTLEKAVERRRSVRDYAGGPLSLEQLSRLVHAAQGVTERRWGFRAAPSAGALYPLELYAVVHDVTGLEPGIYHYDARDHSLELVEGGDFGTAIAEAGLWQSFLAEANVCFVLSAIFQRTRWRYRERTYRYVTLEAGHVGQNLYLAATSMGLGACAVGAFLDDELNELLGLDGKEEAALYIVSVGTV